LYILNGKTSNVTIFFCYTDVLYCFVGPHCNSCSLFLLPFMRVVS
jgi:hypothetical protein